MLKTVVKLFLDFLLLNRMFRGTAFIYFFVSAVTFDQFNVSLLNINFLKKKIIVGPSFSMHTQTYTYIYIITSQKEQR